MSLLVDRPCLHAWSRLSGVTCVAGGVGLQQLEYLPGLGGRADDEGRVGDPLLPTQPDGTPWWSWRVDSALIGTMLVNCVSRHGDAWLLVWHALRCT